MTIVRELRVNGRSVQVEVDRDRTLLSVLRHELELTGTKYGCGEAQCGACTVLLDGAPARACVTRVDDVGAREITTIEGLERDGELHPVQEAFLEADALQCGYCTSGMIMSAVALLERTPEPNAAQIARGLDGNLCRCCVYPRITAAVQRAAQAKKEQAR